MSEEFFTETAPEEEIELSENLVKAGDDLDLTKLDPTLKRLNIGLGWTFRSFDSDPVDLDVSLFLLNHKGETRDDGDFIFYNQPEALDRGVKHHGDSRDGAGEGDDENISIDLQAVPFDITTLEFVLSIYKAGEKDQNFDMLKNSYLRIVNEENNFEMARYVLDDEFKDSKGEAMIVATIERDGPKWHFRPKGDFDQGTLGQIAERRGLVIVNA